MALARSPPRTRSQTTMVTGETSCPVEQEAVTMQVMAEELRRLRGEREQDRQELQELRRQLGSRDHRPTTSAQLSRSNSSLSFGKAPKADVFDGSVPLREYLGQFELIARAGEWDEMTKSIYLAAQLRGKARSVIDGWNENLGYDELKTRLELRFGDHSSYQNSYIQFTNRKQKFGEDYATFGEELERLSRLAYSESNAEVRDKISCAQFITGINDGFVKRTIQLEGIISLRAAVQRAVAIDAIQGNSFPRKKKYNENYEKKELVKSSDVEKNECSQRKSVPFWKTDKTKGKECWHCGKVGHFRSECPALGSNNQSN